MGNSKTKTIKKVIHVKKRLLVKKTEKIMNLFVLSLCFAECAQWMFDKHISKMILETAQMLCTTKRVLDPEGVDLQGHDIVYKLAHKNHPVTIWMRTSYANYCWALDMVDAMHAEWKYRYDHPAETQHKSYVVCQWLRDHPPPLATFPETGLTPFAQAMPDEYKCEGDAIKAYREYYQSPEKKRIAKWTKRQMPPWYRRTIRVPKVI